MSFVQGRRLMQQSRMSDERAAVVITAAVAGAVLALTGVRSHSAEASTAAHKATPINACSLLTADEVEQVIGVNVEAGSRQDDGWVDNDTVHGAYSSTCLWRASADRNMADPSLPAGGASFAI